MKGKNDKYQRIHSTENDGDEETASLNSAIETSPQPMRRKVKRRGSHNSLSSYRSLDYLTDEDDDNNSNNANLTAERSPLRGSFDSSPESSSQQHQHQQELPSSGSLKSAPSPKPVQNPSLSNLYSSSFNFSDDEDDFDDEANLKRYHLDFSIHAGGTATLSNSLHGGGVPNNNLFSNSNSTGGTSTTAAASLSSLPTYLWFSFQSVRQQARQRRAQLLLQQSGERRQWFVQLWICILTYCDATDQGIGVLISLLAVWGIVLWNTVEHIRSSIFWTGLGLLVVRIGARPFWEFASRLRQRRRQQRQLRELQQPQPLPQASPSLKPRIVYYSDQQQQQRPNTSTTTTNTGTLELQSVRRVSNGPTLASITATTTTPATAPRSSPKSNDPAIHTI